MKSENITKTILIITLLLIATLVLGHPLLWKGYLNGADLRIHLLWTQQFLKSLDAGHFLPQWLCDVNLGCGSPSFIFYMPFPFLISGVLNFFVNEVLWLLSLSGLIGLFFSGVTMYVFTRTYLQRFSALLSSVAYMGLPYHLIDLYGRSALAEYWAFVWCPLVCFFVVKVRKGSGSWLLGLSLSYAGLIMTHIPTAVLLSLFLFLLLAFNYVEERRKEFLFWRLVGISLGLGLTSFYLVPGIFEQKNVNIGILGWYWNAFDDFLFSAHSIDVEFNKRLSQVALTTSLFGISSLFFCLFLPPRSHRRSLSNELVFAIGAAVSFLMMLRISKPFWNLFRLFPLIHFPWRTLSISTLCAAVCFGFVVERFIEEADLMKRGMKIAMVGCLLGLLILSGVYSYLVASSSPFFSFKEIDLLKKENWAIRADLSYSEMAKNFQLCFKENYGIKDMPEYRTVWSIQRSLPAGLKGEKFDDYESYGPYIISPPSGSLHQTGVTDREIVIPREMLEEYVVFEKGRGDIRILQWKPEKRLMEGTITEPAKILVRTFYYPRWEGYIDKYPAAITPHSHTGLIEIDVPQGRHIIELRFKNSPCRLIGFVLSIVSLGMIVSASIWISRFKSPRILGMRSLNPKGR